MGSAYGVNKYFFFPSRKTFLINEKGILVHIFDEVNLHTHPKDILKGINLLNQEKCDLVIGSKYLKDSIVKNRKITDFKYQGESCVYCQASASLLSRNIKNKTNKKIEFLLKQASNLFKNKKIHSNKEWKNFFKIMNKSNILRKECLLLPIKATLKALKN